MGAARLLLGFAFILTVGIMTLTGVLVHQNYKDQISRAETATESASHLVAVQFRWLVEAGLQALERLATRLENDTSWRTTEVMGDIDDAIDALPQGVAISVFGPAGNLRLSNANNATAINVSDREYFQALAAGEQTHISEMLISRFDGEPSFAIARRLEVAGEFAGTAAISVSQALLRSFWVSLNLEPGATISIFRRDGKLVARHPPPAASVDLSDYVLFTDYLPQATSGTYRAPASPVDGVERIVSYRTIEGLPLVALAAVPVDRIVSRFWRNLAIVLSLMIPIALMLLIAIAWLWVILRRDHETQEQLRRALEHNKVLFREIHHRVKNNLQAVSSLLRLQPLADEAKAEMQRRIAAMVAVHEQIYKTDQFEKVDVSDYVGRLVQDLASGYSDRIAVQTDLESVLVDKDHAVPIGLIVSEAVSNSVKHAFPDEREGTISVSLKVQASGRGELSIADDGVGFDHTIPAKGMGRRLIAGFVAQIGGDLCVDGSGGTTYRVTFPLAGEAGPDSAEPL